MKKRVASLIIVAWIVVWVLFLVRPLIKQGLLGDYAVLPGLTLEGKRAYVTGEDLYSFVRFCKESVPGPSTYKIIGLEDDQLGMRRAAYYLYPSVGSDTPEYIFVYNCAGYAQKGYVVGQMMSDRKFILARRPE